MQKPSSPNRWASGIALALGACSELRTTVANWKAINDKDLVTFNALLAKNNLKALPTAAGLPAPEC